MSKIPTLLFKIRPKSTPPWGFPDTFIHREDAWVRGVLGDFFTCYDMETTTSELLNAKTDFECVQTANGSLWKLQVHNNQFIIGVPYVQDK